MLLCRSVARRHLLVTPSNLSVWRRETIPIHSYRSLTTPSTDTTPEVPRPDPSHLQSTPPRKQKVGLRPGPVKTPPINQAVATPSPVDAEKQAKDVGDPVPEPGIVETAKIDYSEASKHGILAPPPADASRIRRVIHQVKEYFVCCGEPIVQHHDAQPRFPEILLQGFEARLHPSKPSQ